MKWPWTKEENDIEFIDYTRLIYQRYPVKMAREVSPRPVKTQQKNSGKFLMAHCPGIIDYAQLGYIVPAWVDMHIKANKAGVTAFIGSERRGTHGFIPPERMDARLVEGLFETDNVPVAPIKFSSPWKIFAKKNVSAILAPAIYHSMFLDDLFVFPGVVDYENFHVSNFICAPKRECEVHIKVGDPLLQVIPFKNLDITAGYGPGTEAQVDSCMNEIPGDDTQYYRKFLRVPKVFQLGTR